jgi:hypothetical protein
MKRPSGNQSDGKTLQPANVVVRKYTPLVTIVTSVRSVDILFQILVTPSFRTPNFPNGSGCLLYIPYRLREVFLFVS